MDRVRLHQLRTAKAEMAECKKLERQFISGVRVLSGWGSQMVDTTDATLKQIRGRRAWAIRRARVAIRGLNDLRVAAA